MVVKKLERISGTASERLLIRNKEVWAMLGISRSEFYKKLSSGGIGPKPVETLGDPLWSAEEMIAWVRAGCPNRETWQRVWRPR